MERSMYKIDSITMVKRIKGEGALGGIVSE